MFSLTGSTKAKRAQNKRMSARHLRQLLVACTHFSLHKMRKRLRTTARGVPREILEMATVEVLEKGNSVGYQSHKRVFTLVQEAELMAYLKDVAGIHCGLSSKEVRKLAFQIAKHNQLKYPEAWNATEMAGKDWFSSFMKRNPQFPVKSFQRPGVGRAMGFNKANVSNFFQSLGKILELECLEAQDVWNVDETGVGTGHAPEDAAAAEKDGDPAESAPSLPSTSKSSADDSLAVVKEEPRTPVPRRRKKKASPVPFSAPLHSTPAEDMEGEKEEAGPAVKCKAHLKRKGRKTEATADGTCPCLFCDDYYLTTV
ncbi:hypothetical protein GJAV_G00166060 [Gymnothorax javanicus]|nr:hypothetical protein GJAV_G00166060 [Gymnothorax javanicus]